MARNSFHRADRDRAARKSAFIPTTPTRPSTKKRTYSTDSTGSSTVGAASFRSAHSSPRKRLSLQSDAIITRRNARSNGGQSSESASSMNEVLMDDDDANDDEEDEDDDYSGVNDFPIEDLTGENDAEDAKLDISDVLFGSQIFGEYHESIWTIYDDLDSPAYRVNTHARKESLSSEKRVRFQEVFMSASSSTTSSDDMELPDLFMNPQDLPAAIRNTWDRSPTPSVVASEDGSYWDFQGSGTENVADSTSAFSANEESTDESESDETDESDDGDNDDDDDDETDEEEIEEIVIHRHPRPRFSHMSSPVTPLSRNARRPIAAEMPIDEDKEYATTINGKVVHFKSPREQNMMRTIRATRGQFEIPTQFFSFLYEDNIASELTLTFSETDIISSSGDLNAMFGAHGGLTSFVDASASTTPIATSVVADTSNSDFSPATSTMSYEGTLQSDDSEDESYRLEDFIQVSEEDGDIYEPGSDDEPSSPTPSAMTAADITPTKAVTASTPSSKAGILDHLDKSKVGSFRNHQDNHRRLSSFGPDPAQRASATTPVRPGKSVDLLTTPMRRRANSNTYRKFGRAVETSHLRQKRGSFSRNH